MVVREGCVGIFFYVDGVFKLHLAELEEASEYGDFLVYDGSHNDVWNEKYMKDYGVDFDYYPRGRIAYRRSDKTFFIYYDTCIKEEVKFLVGFAVKGKYEFVTDEHYVCHECNENYLT